MRKMTHSKEMQSSKIRRSRQVRIGVVQYRCQQQWFDSRFIQNTVTENEKINTYFFPINNCILVYKEEGLNHFLRPFTDWAQNKEARSLLERKLAGREKKPIRSILFSAHTDSSLILKAFEGHRPAAEIDLKTLCLGLPPFPIFSGEKRK